MRCRGEYDKKEKKEKKEKNVPVIKNTQTRYVNKEKGKRERER